MKSLKLFNAVIKKPSDNPPFVSDLGIVIEPGALWAKENIVAYVKEAKLSGRDLNQTFHKSWQKILQSSRAELLVDQILHYISTYGSNFQDEIYIPDELLKVPETKLSYRVIKAMSQADLQAKSLSMLKSGMALKEETVDDLLSLLVDELSYTFTGKEGIRNKEAQAKIADMYGVLPEDPTDFLRLMVFRATGESLLIKSNDAIEAIKKSSFNPTVQLHDFGLDRLAEIFNRFKPIFLAFKPRCKKTINRISKLSKKHHKPMVQNPLNHATNTQLKSSDIHWLDNATPFALFKALSACHCRRQGQDSFVYRIRNEKSWVTKGNTNPVAIQNYDALLAYLKSRFDLSGKTFYIPPNVNYALPTSEKMYVGNVPTGSQFIGKNLAIGIYWRDDWGAEDIDLSGLNVAGKVGWNSDYSQAGHLLYSGDITSAPNGAVEYLYAKEGLSSPTLINSNVYSGRNNCEYKIVIGEGEDVTYDYMMNPNRVFTEIKCQSVQHQTVIGILLPYKHMQRFVLLNFGAGHSRVAGNSPISMLATRSLFQQWNNPFMFKDLVELLGGKIADSPVDDCFDLSLDRLARDSFLLPFT